MSFFGWIISLGLHGSILLSFLLGNILYPEKKLEILEPSTLCTIPLDVTAVSDISQAPISKKKAKKLKGQEEDRIKEPEETPKKEEKDQRPYQESPKEATPEPEKPLLEKKEKEVQKKEEKNMVIQDVLPDPKKNENKIQKNSPKKSSFRMPSEKAIKATIKKNQKYKKNDQKKDYRGKANQDFKDVLYNADKEAEDGPESETPITDPNSDSPYGAESIGPEMSMSDMDRLRRMLHQAWQIPLRASEGGGLQIYVTIKMNPNGTIAHAEVVSSQSTTHHPAYALGVESVMRAIDYFRINPLPLSKKSYASWKTFDFRFQANQAL